MQKHVKILRPNATEENTFIDSSCFSSLCVHDFSVSYLISNI